MPSNRLLWPPKSPTEFEKSLKSATFRSPKYSSGHSNAVSKTCGRNSCSHSIYIYGELDREEAIEHVGRTKVEQAEREREVVEEDVNWGLNA